MVWNWSNLEKLISAFEVNDFECYCLPRPPVRQTREMWRIMRDTRPLFPSSPTDPMIVDTDMVPAKERRDLRAMLSHNSHPSPSPPFPSPEFSHTFKSMLPGTGWAARKCVQFFKRLHASDRQGTCQVWRIILKFMTFLFDTSQPGIFWLSGPFGASLTSRN